MCLAQNAPKATLDTSETLFTILAAMNTCGYDQELSASDPIRKQVRGEISRAAHESHDALEATNLMCQYYHEHVRPDSARELAQYISLALYLGAAGVGTIGIVDFDVVDYTGTYKGGAIAPGINLSLDALVGAGVLDHGVLWAGQSDVFSPSLPTELGEVNPQARADFAMNFDSELLPDLLSRRSFSAAMARTTP